MHSPTGCGLTVLRARGRRLCKVIRADGTLIPYDAARTFDLHHEPLADLAALADLLRRLLSCRDAAVVRGAILDPARTRRVRRLLHPDAETGDAPTLREVPRRWLALDVDGLDLPPGTDPRDLAACARAVLPHLPAEFRHARAVVTATASHGIKPGARLRLWYWLTRPASGAEAAQWLRGAPVDASIFTPAQVIYTAAPLREAGAADPVPCRLAILPGAAEVVRVPPPLALAPPPRVLPAMPPRRVTGNHGRDRYAAAALARAAESVARAPVNSRHLTAKREAWAVARFVRAGLLTEAEVKDAIGAALEAAGKARSEGEKVAAWAVAHRADTGEARR
ncbi:MAG: hypothetical protein QJR07_12095 [Acetobacteraceae bacterium]|nr:hypothetical protein [Acetobacteraceae bacterium]